MKFITEQQLEDALITELEKLNYKYRPEINTLDLVEENLRHHIERLNDYKLSDDEFNSILLKFNQPLSIYERTIILREGVQIKTEDGSSFVLSLLKTGKDWAKNSFEVTNQIKINKLGGNERSNRLDVTILINGLPLVQVELKKSGISLKEAFNQTARYKRQSFDNSVFDFIQLFVVSNQELTKYYANNEKLDYEFSFEWTDEDNEKITNLFKFSEIFFRQCNLIKMISDYIVIDNEDKILKVLRPYQIHAIEKVVEKVDDYKGGENRKDSFGYIWHTTGSGKTITSYKIAELLSKRTDIKKVFFVVDRLDLNEQTEKEYNKISTNVKKINKPTDRQKLYEAITDSSVDIIVTTIQKLDGLLRDFKNKKLKFDVDPNIFNQRYVMLFDECHRSQFGKQQRIIEEMFTNTQMFGFTGTPIFPENSVFVKNENGENVSIQNATTKDIFTNELHHYLIANAINDNSVLPFKIDYIGPKARGNGNDAPELIEVDENLKDKEEIYRNWKNLPEGKYRRSVVEEILRTIGNYTKNGKFHAMLATTTISSAIEYYDIFTSEEFQDIKEIKVATIFTTSDNDESNDPNVSSEPNNQAYARIIEDYCNRFTTDKQVLAFNGLTSEGKKLYEKDVIKRFKNGEIDLLIVVNMYLTGFDDPKLNTLYYDKNLIYHNLIQAFSRTNRVCRNAPDKIEGHVISFNNDREKVDEALALFSKNNNKFVRRYTYEELRDKFNQVVNTLLNHFPDIDDVYKAREDKKEISEFINEFRDVMREYDNVRQTRSFNREDFKRFDEGWFNSYKSIYLEEYRKRERRKTKTNEEVEPFDFELERFLSIYVDQEYLKQVVETVGKKYHDEKEDKSDIYAYIQNTACDKSTKEIITKWLEENPGENSWQDFLDFSKNEKNKEIEALAMKYDIDGDKLLTIIENTPIYMGVKEPTKQLLKDANVGFRKRIKIAEDIEEQILDINERYQYLSV